MTTTYDVKCPRCSSRAVAHMEGHGTKGTYFEVYERMVARRVTCANCGYAQTSESPDGLAIEYWFKLSYKNHTVWAPNERYLKALSAWLAEASSPEDLQPSRVDGWEALPQWMIDRKNRYEIARRLERLLD